jgi:two-component system, sensor histidine kinase PhcS
MISLPAQNDDSPIATAYREFVRNLRLRQAKTGYLLPFALVPAALSLDYFVYPQMLWPMFKARMLCNLILVPFFALLFTRYAHRLIRILGNAWLIAPAVIICWMIYATEGALSPYYAGLNLVMLAGSLLTTYRAREATVFCAFVLASYAIACLLHRVHPPNIALHPQVQSTAGTLFNNMYFLAATATVCVTASFFGSRRRFEDFCLRHNLHVSNTDLASTLKKLQETEVQLVQSEKMNALGKLSAGLLHEVNNPLNFTFMALQMAEQEAEGNASLQDTLKDIGQGMTRIRGVISDLRAFAHPTNGTERETFALDESLTSALRLCAHEMGDIPVVRKGTDGAMAIGSKTQIVHVFMNLLVNAAHATKKKKVISPQITVSCEPVDGRLKVSVRDNGTGVKREHLPRLLEPFFTTKDVGQGMGLGLSICHTIIKNHGGTIEITTEEGEWTQVSFYLSLEPTKAVSLGDSAPAQMEERLELAGSNA